MKTDDFDYELPESYIAQTPLVPRDCCKLMVLFGDGSIEHRIFSDIIDYINPGDLLVVNTTRVLPARLLGRKAETNGAAEALLLNKVDGAPDSAAQQTWECLVKPGKRLKPGTFVEFSYKDEMPVLRGEILSINPNDGSRMMRLTSRADMSVDDAIQALGHTPLPPYIHDYTGDEELYQTVYAQTPRSAAAPTAGLHFTKRLLERIKEKGAHIAGVDLEVGLDTFRIVTQDDPKDHKMHTELYTVPEKTVAAIEQTKACGKRVIAVGTTSVRSLESACVQGKLCACERAATGLYILPGYEFHVVDAIVTNFHVPRSTLMMLVSAFSGRENIMNAYEQAKRENYRFFSFGDAMLLL